MTLPRLRLATRIRLCISAGLRPCDMRASAWLRRWLNRKHYLTKSELNALYFATHRMKRPRGWNKTSSIGRHWRAALMFFFNLGVDTGSVWARCHFMNQSAGDISRGAVSHLTVSRKTHRLGVGSRGLSRSHPQIDRRRMRDYACRRQVAFLLRLPLHSSGYRAACGSDCFASNHSLGLSAST